MTPSAPLGGSGSGSYRIPELVSLAGEGSIRVPTFQRAFVWDSDDVRTLFDSFFRGFPVGTLLLWRRLGPAGPTNLGPIKIEGREDLNALWVVDGQQRIISIFGSLSPDHRDVDDRFEVYFDLATSRFINPRRGVVPARAIPVREALETRSLLNWLRQHDGDLEPEDYDLADRLAGALRDYRIPAYVVSGNDQNVLREVFDRVNSAGKPITRAQVFHALFAAETEPGSPASVVEELKRLNFGALDENRIVQSLLAIRGGNVQRDIHEEFDEDEDPADWYDKTEEALERTIKFLRSEGVEHLLLAPNTLPIPVLAAFFYLHPEPEPWTLRLLSHWLWRGWVHGFGREEGQTPTLRRAIFSVNPGRRRRDQELPSEYEAVKALLDYVSDREPPEISLHNFRTNSSNGRLVLLALASLRPRRPDGGLIDLSSELEMHGVDAITELVLDHRSEAAARGFWPRKYALRSTELAVLESHAVGVAAAESLDRGDIREFLELRGQRIKQLVPEFLKSRLETDSVVRPPLADLIVAGTAEED